MPLALLARSAKSHPRVKTVFPAGTQDVIFGNSQLFKLANCNLQGYCVHKSDHKGRRCSIGHTEMPLPVRRRTVIMYGNDSNLLQLRSTFLQGHGWRAWTAGDPMRRDSGSVAQT